MMGLHIYAGRGICLPIPDDDTPHLYIALTGSRSYQDKTIAVANLTSLGSSRGADTTVVLLPYSHPFINCKTVINYGDAFIANAEQIKQSVLLGDVSFRDDFTDDLLEKIQQGALTSKYTPEKVKQLVKEFFL